MPQKIPARWSGLTQSERLTLAMDAARDKVRAEAQPVRYPRDLSELTLGTVFGGLYHEELAAQGRTCGYSEM